MTTPRPEDPCTCGHTRDEHDEFQACTIEGCGCIHFDYDSEAAGEEESTDVTEADDTEVPVP